MVNILIVDDEVHFRFFLEEILSKEGFGVTAVANGQEALNEIAAQSFDLALVDFTLQDMTGLEIVEQLRRVSSQTPVIMLTGHSEPQMIEQINAAGIDHYVMKPCRAAQLRERVRKILRVPAS